MVGKTLGKKYQILEKLREQRFYDVYAARLMNTETRNIVKVLSPDYVQPGRTLAGLKPNLAVVAGLRHPGIAALRDFDEDGSVLFVAEDYYEGTLLRDILDAGSSMNSLQTLELGIRITEALAHAHGKGLAHGLLSPESVVVMDDLSVKVSDFHLLSAATSGMNISQSGSEGRDVRYCPPEVIAGISPTPRADVYAAGAMLYELMTGRLPFTRQESIEIALDKDHFSPAPPRDLNPRVPELLNAVILKALKPKPASRYENASELLSELLLCRSSMMRAISTDQYAGLASPDKPLGGRRDAEETRHATRTRATIDERPGAAEPLTTGPSVLEEVDVDNKKMKKRLTLAVISGVVFLALLVFVAALFFNMFSGRMDGGGTVEVPDVVRLTATEARSILGLKDFETKIEEEYSEDVPEGTVARQEPAAGTRVKPGRTITLFISRGEQQEGIPDFVNMPERDAEERIESLGFKLGDKEYDYSDEVAKGKVMEQRPRAGSKRPLGTVIKLVISKGKEPNLVEMPDLIGLDVNEARTLLSENGIPLGNIKTMATQSSTPDSVVEQSVLAGTEVNTSSMEPVDITIAEQPGGGSPDGEDVFGGGGGTRDYVKSKTINMTIAEDGTSEVVVVVTDKNSRKEVYRKKHKKGDKISVPVSGSGDVVVKIYINGALEKELAF